MCNTILWEKNDSIWYWCFFTFTCYMFLVVVLFQNYRSLKCLQMNMYSHWGSYKFWMPNFLLLMSKKFFCCWVTKQICLMSCFNSGIWSLKPYCFCCFSFHESSLIVAIAVKNRNIFMPNGLYFYSTQKVVYYSC